MFYIILPSPNSTQVTHNFSMSRSVSLRLHDTRHGRMSVSSVPNGPSDSLNDYHNNRASPFATHHVRSSSSSRSATCYDDGISNLFVARAVGVAEVANQARKDPKSARGRRARGDTHLLHLRAHAVVVAVAQAVAARAAAKRANALARAVGSITRRLRRKARRKEKTKARRGAEAGI